MKTSFFCMLNIIFIKEGSHGIKNTMALRMVGEIYIKC